MADIKHPSIPTDNMDLFNLDGNPEVGSYKDDKKTGEWKYYHDTRMLKAIGVYEDDLRIGE